MVQDPRPFARAGAEVKPMVHAMLRAVGTAVEPLEMGGADFFLRSDFAEVEAVRRHVTGG
jgi:hypothetical protein